MTHDEMIAVIEAARDGKQIESRPVSNQHPSLKWRDGTGLIFDFVRYEYRVKPEPKRPTPEEIAADVDRTNGNYARCCLKKLREHGYINDPAPAPNLVWSDTLNDGESMTFAKAEKAVAELGPHWRLPTRRELESLLDLDRYDPTIDAERYPDTRSCAYWSSTPCVWNKAAAWVVGFGLGGVSYNPHGSIACVRAVRESLEPEERATAVRVELPDE